MNNQLRIALAALVGTGVAAAAIILPQDDRGSADRSPNQRTRPANPGGTDTDPGGPKSAPKAAAVFPTEFRTIDGVGNNGQHPEWGAAGEPFLRLAAADYGDGAHTPAGAHRPSARAISNHVASQTQPMPNPAGASDYLWMWGQFLDHDLTETPVAAPPEAFDIQVPSGDTWFDPGATGTATIPLERSSYDTVAGVRQQVNLITAFIDASNVYGSEPARAAELRTLDGTGRLKTSAGDLLPFNVNGFHNAGGSDPTLFLAGDIRANEQVALTAMHTLFVREHNHWADRIGALGSLPGDTIYELARAIVAAEMQAITYREFLPLLLGADALPAYQGYDDQVDPTIANEFAAAGYRFGHTMLSPTLLRVQRDGSTHAAGHLPLAQAFFDPSKLTSIGVEPYLRGLSRQRAQTIDPFLVDDVRNMLFGPPGAGGFDLAALNLQRGRDHGLASYNDLRQALGLPRAQTWGDISSSREVQTCLKTAYANVDDIDAWMGLLCEDHAPGAMVGPTLRALFVDQFRRLRDGDRFWYTSYLPPVMAQFVEKQTLAQIIRRNTGIAGELQDDVFRAR